MHYIRQGEPGHPCLGGETSGEVGIDPCALELNTWTTTTISLQFRDETIRLLKSYVKYMFIWFSKGKHSLKFCIAYNA